MVSRSLANSSVETIRIKHTNNVLPMLSLATRDSEYVDSNTTALPKSVEYDTRSSVLYDYELDTEYFSLKVG